MTKHAVGKPLRAVEASSYPKLYIGNNFSFSKRQAMDPPRAEHGFRRWQFSRCSPFDLTSAGSF